ncbi:HNH endonuclease [Burkholderia cepacia]|uniref:HNH endonuclease n=1 Tax=Burkholderia cepacia TaxID=292 RepID=UPI001CF5F67D|nr:HNH endonuclease [Burkholderia cepacia]MCA8278512.1 HNH endonuclease [Burkholderia cepacia]
MATISLAERAFVTAAHIVSVEVAIVHFVYQLRNEWINWNGDTSKVKRPIAGVHLSVDEATATAEKWRVPGTSFAIKDSVAIALYCDGGVALIHESHSDTPFRELIASLKKVRDKSSLRQIVASLPTARSLEMTLRIGKDVTELEHFESSAQLFTRTARAGGRKNGLGWSLLPCKVDPNHALTLAASVRNAIAVTNINGVPVVAQDNRVASDQAEAADPAQPGIDHSSRIEEYLAEGESRSDHGDEKHVAPVNFAAVHDRHRWRKHDKHSSFVRAVDGKDGAKALLLQRGRIANMWQRYGDVRCVFVWEDGADTAVAFRLDPATGATVEEQRIAIERVLRFDSSGYCSDEDVASCFDHECSSEGRLDRQPECHTAGVPFQYGTLYPEELSGDGVYAEGAVRKILVNEFERSQAARDVCIAHHGCLCAACGINFREKYGELGDGFIHVHHRVPIASIGVGYQVDPIADLIPVCPNCHAMLHRREPPLDVDELKVLVGNSRC